MNSLQKPPLAEKFSFDFFPYFVCLFVSEKFVAIFFYIVCGKDSKCIYKYPKFIKLKEIYSSNCLKFNVEDFYDVVVSAACENETFRVEFELVDA